MPSKMV